MDQLQKQALHFWTRAYLAALRAGENNNTARIRADYAYQDFIEVFLDPATIISKETT